MWNVEFGVQSVEVRCRVESVDCEVWSGEWRVWSVKCGMCGKCKV